MFDRRGLVLLIALGLAVRVAIIASSVGTNDVAFMLGWARLVREHGLADAYRPYWELNHPPLSLLILHLLDQCAALLRVQVTDALRLFQAGADLLTLWVLRRFALRFDLNPNLGLYYFLCPAVVFVSAFHCNTDPTMVALTALAILLLALGRDAGAGIALACAVGIKIPPLLLAPVFLAAARNRPRFVAAFAAAFAAIFLPVHILSDGAMTRNVFGYAGFAGKWGITGVALALERATGLHAFRRAAELYYAAGGFVIVAAIAMIALLTWRRTQTPDRGGTIPAEAVTAIFLTMLTLAPGFGVQYLIWPLPFLLVSVPRVWALATMAAVSAYLFLTYSIWSGGFPWWYADSIRPSPLKPLVTQSGFAVWILIAVAAGIAIRNIVNARTALPVSDRDRADSAFNDQ